MFICHIDVDQYLLISGEVYRWDGEDHNKNKNSETSQRCWMVFRIWDEKWLGMACVSRMHVLTCALVTCIFSNLLAPYVLHLGRRLPAPKSFVKNLKELTRISGAPGTQIKTVCHSHHEILPRLAMARTNVYDGAMEYWVVVREHGSHEESHEQQERTKSTEALDATST